VPRPLAVTARYFFRLRRGLEITAFEPPALWSERGHGWLADAQLAVAFNELGDLTEVRVEVEISFKARFKWLSPLVRRPRGKALFSVRLDLALAPERRTYPTRRAIKALTVVLSALASASRRFQVSTLRRTLRTRVGLPGGRPRRSRLPTALDGISHNDQSAMPPFGS
jgi:hypothetical protein